jgi:2-polyprenyl-3-methyl-5-hydroxy-6-metoxy-1,4-benzoquinol methylase
MKIEVVNAAGYRLSKKIQSLDIAALPISEYSKKYFAGYFHECFHDDSGFWSIKLKARMKSWVKKSLFIKKSFYPGQYVVILNMLLRDKTLDELQGMTFLDHGGGTGLLSLLAAELGFGQVYYNDIYEVSCHDSTCIAEALGYGSIIRIPGDFEDIALYCKNYNLSFDCIGSYDVIEHIYDIHAFLEKIPIICSPQSSIFLYSGANSNNPQIVQELSMAHERIEHENREYTPGWKERDSLRSYASIRAEIVKNEYLAQGLPEPDVDTLEKLTVATRGLMVQDIKHAVRAYIATKVLPQTDARFPSNTCDPMTGNWAEHLMDFSELLAILEKSFEIYSLYPEADELPRSRQIGLYASKKRPSTTTLKNYDHH